MRAEGRWPALALVVLTLLVGASALAARIGSGTLDLQVNVLGLSFTGSAEFDDATLDVFGTPVNLGTVGTLTGTGELTGFSAAGGLFTTTFSSSPAGALGIQAAGEVVPVDPGSLTLLSFVGNVESLTGSAVAGLPAGLVHTIDGTLTCSGSILSPTCQGDLALNAFETADTPVGAPVMVSRLVRFFSSRAGMEVEHQVVVEYPSVTQAGNTLITGLSNASGTIPDTFLTETPGFFAPFIDIVTDATVTSPISVCISFVDANGDGIVDGALDANGDPLDANSLALLHRENGTFVDRTALVDVVDRLVCGEVDSLSPFALVVRVGPPPTTTTTTTTTIPSSTTTTTTVTTITVTTSQPTTTTTASTVTTTIPSSTTTTTTVTTITVTTSQPTTTTTAPTVTTTTTVAVTTVTVTTGPPTTTTSLPEVSTTTTTTSTTSTSQSTSTTCETTTTTTATTSTTCDTSTSTTTHPTKTTTTTSSSSTSSTQEPATTTTHEASTTTTTIPVCGPDRLRCACEAGLDVAACAGEPVPAAVRRAHAKACHALTRLGSAKPRAAQRMSRVAQAELGKAAKRAARSRLSASCVEALVQYLGPVPAMTY